MDNLTNEMKELSDAVYYLAQRELLHWLVQPCPHRLNLQKRECTWCWIETVQQVKLGEAKYEERPR